MGLVTATTAAATTNKTVCCKLTFYIVYDFEKKKKCVLQEELNLDLMGERQVSYPQGHN
jgi:hypothetical protein